MPNKDPKSEKRMKYAWKLIKEAKRSGRPISKKAALKAAWDRYP